MADCTKVHKAEEIAKCHLKEMHLDLSAHCRSKIVGLLCFSQLTLP